MNLAQTPRPSDVDQKTRGRQWLFGVLLALLYAVSELIALWLNGSRQFWVITPVFIVALFSYWLFKAKKYSTASLILILGVGIQSILLSLVQRGLSIPNAVTAFALIITIGLGTLPRSYTRHVLIIGLFTGLVTILMDTFGNLNRPLATLVLQRWAFTAVMLVLATVFLARQLSTLDIRTKIVLGILGTGGLALAIVVFFALFQIQQITDALSKRLDTSVKQLAEEQLINTASIEASRANHTFENIAGAVTSLAQQWGSYRTQKEALSENAYWDASTKLIKLAAGQYGNSPNDPASLFIPTGTVVDNTVIKDLNLSAYLDFSAPEVLKTYPSLLAVYAIDTRGITRYYPNINLAALLPPDFDATSRPYFTITSPLFNPQRLPRWTIPYVDATGGGLVVTVAAPLYQEDEFLGVVAADMQLGQITDQISSIRVGETGYAFIIDDAGRILSMPPAGYKMFGIHPEDINSEEFFKQTILGKGSIELQAVTKRMTSGGNGLLVAHVNGVDTYISFSPIKVNGYSVALVVPVAELQGAIISAHNETEQQKRSASQTAIVILILLLILAIGVSLGLGRIIAAPIQRLTQVATLIANGDLSVHATATTGDETGTLAYAFNTMTARLRETLDGLEYMVKERTAELSTANEKNERRAKQFESIAQVARTISSTNDLDILLPQITTVISREFGFYHVGIFLLDTAKEYAVLSAANSEGGRDMLARGHRLKVGEKGIVGYVTGTGEARVALDTEADAKFFNNPDLPETHSEIALPLRAGTEIIGALDVQSTEPNAFSQEDISILSTLADQVSIAIQNAQQFEQTHKALGEAEALAKQFAQTGWHQFTKSKNLVGIRHTGARSTVLYEKKGQEKGVEPWERDMMPTKTKGAYLSLPIKLRGEVIGSVDVRSPDNRPWDQDELDIVIAILERAAIAMENARLLEESQRLASKEAKIGEVTAKISSSINMRNVLQTAVEELGRALPGSEVVIQFQKDQNRTKSTL